MGKVYLSDLSVIPYVNWREMEGRFLTSLMFFDDGKWKGWHETPHGFKPIALIDVAEGAYFAAKPQRESDTCMLFLNILVQHANSNAVARPLLGIQDDIFNLYATAKKLEFFYQQRAVFGPGLNRIVQAEIEFLVFSCMGFFDLMQEIARDIWKTVKLFDETIQKKDLRDTFSKMVLDGDKQRTEDSYKKRFGLSEPLVAFYLHNTEYFLELRKLRTKLIHLGSTAPKVFVGEKGFLIKESDALPTGMSLFRDEDRSANGLISLEVVVTTLIYRTLVVCEHFAHCLQNAVIFPGASVPNMAYFLRTYFNEPLCSQMAIIAERVREEDKIAVQIKL